MGMVMGRALRARGAGITCGQGLVGGVASAAGRRFVLQPQARRLPHYMHGFRRSAGGLAARAAAAAAAPAANLGQAVRQHAAAHLLTDSPRAALTPETWLRYEIQRQDVLVDLREEADELMCSTHG